MHFRVFALALAGSTCITVDSAAQSEARSPRAAYPPVTVLNTQSRRIHSNVVGQDYELKVWLPESYDTTTRRYPVVYLMDGDILFAAATDVARFLQWGGSLPEVIIVSPAYGSVHGPANRGTNMRARDFSVFPTQSAYVPNGGANHLRFIREELMPYVERELRADTTDRTLVGASRSGEFTVHTLLTMPDLFQRYVMIDSYQPGYIALEDSLFTRRKELRKRVFLSSRIPDGSVWQFVGKMRSRGYAGLEVDYATLDSQHVATMADGLAKGLRSVFRRLEAR